MATASESADSRLGRLEGLLEGQTAQLARMEAEHRADFRAVNARIDNVTARIDSVTARIDRMFWAILGVGGGLLATSIGGLIMLGVKLFQG